MAITTKAVPIKAHWSISIIEQYHVVLCQAYKVIMGDLSGMEIIKKIGLQMAVKAINNIAGLNDFVPMLLIFGAYLRMHALDLLASTIAQCAMAIQKAIDEVKKIRSEKEANDALNIRNKPIVNHFHDLSLNSNVFVWREK